MSKNKFDVMSNLIKKHFEIINSSKEYDIRCNVPMTQDTENSLKKVGYWLESLYNKELEPVSEEQEKFVEIGNLIKYFMSVEHVLISKVLELINSYELNGLCKTFLNLKVLESIHKDKIDENYTKSSKTITPKSDIKKSTVKNNTKSKLKSPSNHILNSYNDSPICTYCGEKFPLGRKELGFSFCLNCSSESRKVFKEDGFHTRDDVEKLKKMIFSNMKKNHRE